MNTNKYTEELNQHAANATGITQRFPDFSAPMIAVLMSPCAVKGELNSVLYNPAICAKLFGDIGATDNTDNASGDTCTDGVCQMKPDFKAMLQKKAMERRAESK